jgi:hypothetical protein
VAQVSDAALNLLFTMAGNELDKLRRRLRRTQFVVFLILVVNLCVALR